MSPTSLLLVLDLAGTFVFALNGALTAIRFARLDLVGVVVLAIVTAVGGGTIRDLLIGDVPPASLRMWYYLPVAVLGGLIAFAAGSRADRRSIRIPMLLLDAAGLSLFAVVGTAKSLDFGLGNFPAMLMGALTAIGGGTIRDIMVTQIPTVLHSELYVIPAMAGSSLLVLANAHHWPVIPAAVAGAIVCFLIRVLGLKYRINVPRVRGHGTNSSS